MACCSCEYALLASIAGCSTLAHSHVQSTSRTPCLCTGFLTTHLYREGYITWRANIPHYSSLASFPRNSMTPITMPLSHSIILQSCTHSAFQLHLSWWPTTYYTCFSAPLCSYSSVFSSSFCMMPTSPLFPQPPNTLQPLLSPNHVAPQSFPLPLTPTMSMASSNPPTQGFLS